MTSSLIQPVKVLANNTPHTLQHDVISSRQEQTPRFMTHHSVSHHEVDRLVWLDDIDFYGDRNHDVYLDWLHNIESFFHGKGSAQARFPQASASNLARAAM